MHAQVSCCKYPCRYIWLLRTGMLQQHKQTDKQTKNNMNAQLIQQLLWLMHFRFVETSAKVLHVSTCIPFLKSHTCMDTCNRILIVHAFVAIIYPGMPISILLVSTNHRQFSNTYVHVQVDVFHFKSVTKLSCRHVSQTLKYIHLIT